MVLIYFYIASASPKNILIRRSTNKLVVLPNAFRGSTAAPQLPSQNSVLPSRISRNYSTLTTERPSVENFKRDPLFVTAFSVWVKIPNVLSAKLLKTSSGELVLPEQVC